MEAALGPWEGSEPIWSAAQRVARETQRRRSELLSMRSATADPGGSAPGPDEVAKLPGAVAEGPAQSSAPFGAPPSSRSRCAPAAAPGGRRSDGPGTPGAAPALRGLPPPTRAAPGAPSATPRASAPAWRAPSAIGRVCCRSRGQASAAPARS
ncbi:unnamed protein product [Prorocentrum cordatum]|uniref:Uncharacterized protein n=1 Tax=Prorocentrum cordatum TaxID=2364126 RepID=A0ABN9ULX4_9DINO|nr:unnamed protein product [Polarella glacialis]